MRLHWFMPIVDEAADVSASVEIPENWGWRWEEVIDSELTVAPSSLDDDVSRGGSNISSSDNASSSSAS